MVAASKSGGSSELELPAAAEDFRTRRIPPAVRNDDFRSAHTVG